MKTSLTASIAIAACLMSASAAAVTSATLVEFEGVVMANQGVRFEGAGSDLLLVPGNRVMLMETAVARLRFADGCEIALEPGAISTIPEMSPCAGGTVVTERAVQAQAVGGGASSGMKSGFWTNPLFYVPAGVVFAYGSYELIKDDKPASP